MEQVLAYIFDALKAKSPSIAAFVLLILGTAHALFSMPESAELLGETASKIGYWVSLVWLGLQGTRTTMLITSDKKK
jgi:hypothetical protein